MTVNELIGLLEAARSGDKLQMKIDDQWKDFDAEEWVGLFAQFRVKPEPRKPREWTVCLFWNGSIATAPEICGNNHPKIRVREVIE